MEVKLNGQITGTVCLNLMDLVLQQGLEPSSVVAEYNFEVVKQDNWQATKLRQDDNIELLSFVGGG